MSTPGHDQAREAIEVDTLYACPGCGEPMTPTAYEHFADTEPVETHECEGCDVSYQVGEDGVERHVNEHGEVTITALEPVKPDADCVSEAA